MPAIRPCELPANALLLKYREGGYADCYATEVEGSVSLAAYVEAFYTSPLFRIERFLLGLFARRPSSDREAGELARGAAGTFAAWKVEARAADQLLVADFTGRTRSWFRVSVVEGGAGTRLWFGSAVVSRRNSATGKSEMGAGFHALLGFHRLYSRLLLRSAGARLPAR